MLRKTVNRQAGTVEAPDLGDAELRINAEAIEGAARDIDLDGKVGGRVDGQVDRVLLPDDGLVPDVIGLVRFEAPLHVVPSPGGHPERQIVEAEFLRHLLDQLAKQAGILLVPLRWHQDLQISPVVGHPDRPITHDAEHRLVVVPRDRREDLAARREQDLHQPLVVGDLEPATTPDAEHRIIVIPGDIPEHDRVFGLGDLVGELRADRTGGQVTG
ncbi:MAG: hypothetical protein JO116_20425 [Planctomycetaceae bacterium]|nr:hypothetical protein [Planctomycetaceae bacterium]